MKDGFWTVVAVDGASAWKWSEAPRDQTRGTARFSQALAHGETTLKEEDPREWNDWHGCRTYEDCNLQIFSEGVIYVAVGEVTKCFGPGQHDGEMIAFLDVLDPANFPKGHRTKVIKKTSVVVIKIHRQQGGD